MNTDGRPTRILMVCTGNIYRSTMAHAVLEQAAACTGMGVIVDSAGVFDEEQDNPIDRRTARVLCDAGYTMPDHCARQIHTDELGEWDLILAMTSCHLNVLEHLAERVRVEHEDAPAFAAELGQGPRVCLYRDFDPEDSGDIPGPWYGDHQDSLDTLGVVERVTPQILALVRQARSEPMFYADERPSRMG